MKKFLFLYCGAWKKEQEIMDAWTNWFASIGDSIVDGGNPLGPGRELTHNGTNDLPHDKEAVTGYSIISAKSIEEAEKIAKDCPIMTSVRVYEAISM